MEQLIGAAIAHLAAILAQIGFFERLNLQIDAVFRVQELGGKGRYRHRGVADKKSVVLGAGQSHVEETTLFGILEVFIRELL